MKSSIPASACLAAFAATVLAGVAVAQQITNPQWVRKPSGADLAQFFPSAARDRNISGRADIECTVQESGTLTDCVVISEAPEGYGFGQATVQAAAKFRMRPRTVDGKPVGGSRVRTHIIWNLGGVIPPRNNTLDPAIVAGAPVMIYRNSDFYPAEAKRAKVEGRAVVECVVQRNYKVADCVVLGEAPVNQGFGAAALRRVMSLEVRPTRASGETAGRKVRFPVYWSAGDSRSNRVDMQRDGDPPTQPPAPPGRQ